MDAYTIYSIYDFYGFVQNIATIGATVTGIFLLFSTLTLLHYGSTSKSEVLFCIVNGLLFFACIFCSVYMNYLQVR